MYALVLGLHAAVGTAALLSFWTAALARKGSPLHRGAGRLYLWAMAAILLSALPLVGRFFVRGDAVNGLFFAYLLVLVGTGVVVAPRAVRLKQDYAAFRGGILPRLLALQLGSGAAVAALGLWFGQSLLLVFGLVGVALSLRLFWSLRRPVSRPGWWLREHFTAMLGNGVATHIAFLSIGLVRVLPPPLAQEMRSLHVAWFLPLGAAVAAITWLNLRQRRRLARRPTTAAAAAVTGGRTT